MTAFHPLVPSKAIEKIEAAGISHAQRLIRDHAAAGLVKSYAMMIETTEVTGEKTCVRGSAIAPALWQRIVRERVDDDVWTGGTVRLAAAELIGGAPAVNITGIGFNGPDLKRLVDQHRGETAQPQQRLKREWEQPHDGAEAGIVAAQGREYRVPDATAIAPGAILATIKQTQAALGLGRTKVNELMNDGRLIRREIDGGVRIEVASIKVLAGFIS